MIYKQAKLLALEFLQRHSEVYVENLLKKEISRERFVFWSAEPINNRGEFYEVEIDRRRNSICWKIVKGFEDLSSIGRTHLRQLHTLRHLDIFSYPNDNQKWVCWLKLDNDSEECYHIRMVLPNGELGESKSVPTSLVNFTGQYKRK